jgi:chromosome segregation ATPase
LKRTLEQRSHQLSHEADRNVHLAAALEAAIQYSRTHEQKKQTLANILRNMVSQAKQIALEASAFAAPDESRPNMRSHEDLCEEHSDAMATLRQAIHALYTREEQLSRAFEEQKAFLQNAACTAQTATQRCDQLAQENMELQFQLQAAKDRANSAEECVLTLKDDCEAMEAIKRLSAVHISGADLVMEVVRTRVQEMQDRIARVQATVNQGIQWMQSSCKASTDRLERQTIITKCVERELVEERAHVEQISEEMNRLREQLAGITKVALETQSKLASVTSDLAATKATSSSLLTAVHRRTKEVDEERQHSHTWRDKYTLGELRVNSEHLNW